MEETYGESELPAVDLSGKRNSKSQTQFTDWNLGNILDDLNLTDSEEKNSEKIEEEKR